MYRFKFKTNLKKYSPLDGYVCNAYTQHSALTHVRFAFGKKWEMFELENAYRKRWIRIVTIGGGYEDGK